MSQSEFIKKIESAKTESERQVGKLFYDMGFTLEAVDSDIKDSNENKIGDVDLVCTFDDYVFLIEVNGEKKAGSKKINDFFSKWGDSEIFKSIRKKHDLGPLSPVMLYFELRKNSDDGPSPATDHHTKTSSKAIVYADDFEYFQKYVNKIGSFARNELLHFIGIQNKEDSREIDAIQFHIGDTVVFSFVQRVDILLNSCYISRRRDRQEGYQRTLSESRIKGISNSIMKQQSLTFPNSILINTPTLIETPSPPSPRPQMVKIKFPTGYCSCRIIDGQHRLLGFSQIPEEMQKRFFLPVIAVQNYDPRDEIQTFIDINSKQKRVDQNLILLLTSGFDWNKNEHEKEYRTKIVVDISQKLNSEYFHGNIFFGRSDESRSDKITLSTMVSSMKKNNLILDDYDKTYKSISKVFMYLSKYLSTHSFRPKTYFGQNKGIRVLFRLLRLFQRNQAKGTINITLENFIKDLNIVMNEEMTKKLDYYYGEAGVNLGATELILALKDKIPLTYGKMKTDLVSLR